MIYTFVVSFALGIAFESKLDAGWVYGALLFIISSVLFFYFRRENFFLAKIIFVIGFAFCLGMLRINFFDTSPNEYLSQNVGKEVSLEARIVEEPDIRDSSARYTVFINQNSFSGYSQKCTDIFLLENSCVAGLQSASQDISDNTHSKSFDSLVLLITDRFPGFKYGDKILVSGKLDLPKNFVTESGTEFDYVSYLEKDKIHFLIYRPKIEKLEEGQGNKIIASLYSIKNNFVKNISEVVPEPNSSLLAGLIFGAKQSLGENLLEDFQKVGLIHMVVLSGYNLTIIVAGILYIASYFGKRKLGFILSVVVLTLFSLMVGLGATVIRASIMAVIAILAKYLGRPNDALRALFIAGLLMLLWNPLTLLGDPSFQLSFMATLGLILFSPIIESFISRQKFQKFIPNKLGLREIASSTFAVQIFLLPLLVRMSGIFSLISFLSNLIILPLVPTVMLFGFTTGLLGFVPLVGKILSWPFGALSYLLTQIIILFTETFASLPFSILKTGTIPLWLILVWYFGYGVLYWRSKILEATK